MFMSTAKFIIRMHIQVDPRMYTLISIPIL
jgi:hypothetical protein